MIHWEDQMTDWDQVWNYCIKKTSIKLSPFLYKDGKDRYYRVHMLGWARPMFWPRVNKKRITITGNGINLWFWKWGEFLVLSLYNWTDLSIKLKDIPIFFDYNRPDNSRLVRGIRDWLIEVPGDDDAFPDDVFRALGYREPEHVYMGQFRYDFQEWPILRRWGERRICYFLLEELERIEDEEEI